MNKIVLLAIFLMSLTTTQAQDKINWMTMNEALAAQEKKPKKIIIDFYTDWCGWCKRLDKDVYENKDVVKYINKNFYAVKFDAEGTETVSYKGKTFTNPGWQEGRRRNSTHQLAQYFRVSGYPNTVFLEENGAVLNQVPGYLKADQYQKLLSYFYSNAYKSKTWAEFTSGK